MQDLQSVFGGGGGMGCSAWQCSVLCTELGTGQAWHTVLPLPGTELGKRNRNYTKTVCQYSRTHTTDQHRRIPACLFVCNKHSLSSWIEVSLIYTEPFRLAKSSQITNPNSSPPCTLTRILRVSSWTPPEQWFSHPLGSRASIWPEEMFPNIQTESSLMQRKAITSCPVTSEVPGRNAASRDSNIWSLKNSFIPRYHHHTSFRSQQVP